MEKPTCLILATLLLAAITVSPLGSANSTEQPTVDNSPFSGISLSGQWFLAYCTGEKSGENFSEFKLKRGYVTVKKKFTDQISARVTQDIAVDKEGDGEGDIEIRLKYLYLKYQFEDMWVFVKPSLEFGLVHRPWLDYEQRINTYRVQGTMYLERYKVLRSADYGITFASLLGGEMGSDYKKKVNKNHPGRYGSLSLGLYNGGGYEAIEKNLNKLFEARLSIRPLPDVFPGAQLSWVGGFGKGNTPESPELTYNAMFASLESSFYLLTAVFYDGVGEVNGLEVTDSGGVYDRSGYSLFGEFRYPTEQLAVFARYDRLDLDDRLSIQEITRSIVGAAWRFHGRSRLVVDYDYLRHEYKDDEYTFEVAVEINY